MFVRKTTHEAAMAAKDATIDGLVIQRDHSHAVAAGHVTTITRLREEIGSLREAAYGADRTAAMYKRMYESAAKTLREIAAQETPNCANIGKRMARMARKELPVLHHDAERETA